MLAIGDLTFLAEPYNVLDNNQLISNIADFLTDTSADESANGLTNGNPSLDNNCTFTTNFRNSGV